MTDSSFFGETSHVVRDHFVQIERVGGGIPGVKYTGGAWRYVIFNNATPMEEVGRGEFPGSDDYFTDHHAAVDKALEFYLERALRTAKFTVRFMYPATGTIVERTFFHTFPAAELTEGMIEVAGGHFQIEAGDFIMNALALAAGE